MTVYPDVLWECIMCSRHIVNLVVVDGYNDYHYIIGVYLIKKEVNVDF